MRLLSWVLALAVFGLFWYARTPYVQERAKNLLADYNAVRTPDVTTPPVPTPPSGLPALVQPNRGWNDLSQTEKDDAQRKYNDEESRHRAWMEFNKRRDEADENRRKDEDYAREQRRQAEQRRLLREEENRRLYERRP